MATTVLSSKGQLVIPLDVRRRLGLKPGDLLDCSVTDGRIILELQAPEAASLGYDADGIPLLKAPDGAPEMTPETVKAILSDFP